MSSGGGVKRSPVAGAENSFYCPVAPKKCSFLITFKQFKKPEKNKKNPTNKPPDLRETPKTIGKCFHSRLILSTEVRERTADKNPLYGKIGIRTHEGKCVILCG